MFDMSYAFTTVVPRIFLSLNKLKKNLQIWKATSLFLDTINSGTDPHLVNMQLGARIPNFFNGLEQHFSLPNCCRVSLK